MFKKCTFKKSELIIDFEQAREEGLFYDSDHMRYDYEMLIEENVINNVSLLPTWSLTFNEFCVVLYTYFKCYL